VALFRREAFDREVASPSARRIRPRAIWSSARSSPRVYWDAIGRWSDWPSGRCKAKEVAERQRQAAFDVTTRSRRRGRRRRRR